MASSYTSVLPRRSSKHPALADHHAGMFGVREARSSPFSFHRRRKSNGSRDKAAISTAKSQSSLREQASSNDQDRESYLHSKTIMDGVGLDDAAPPPEVPRGHRGTQLSARLMQERPHAAPASSQSNQQSSSATTADLHDVQSLAGSVATYQTDATSIHTLPALQTKGFVSESDPLEPVVEDDPSSYDLVAPGDDLGHPSYSLELRGEQIFSVDHLQRIFDDPTQLLKFTSFLGTHRPLSIPLLIYYLDALKALRSIQYANAVAEALEPLQDLSFTKTPPKPTKNTELEARAKEAFERLAQEDLPAFVTHIFTGIVSASIKKKVTGTLPPQLKDASEGLAEVFCLSDPSRPDNPIVFASEEFHRTSQYGMSYAIGRNCRFLQGPRTSKHSARRLREAIHEGRDHSETFVNYRRDGTPFLNLLMVAPLRDNRGTLRYFIGAQVDVSNLAKECAGLEALKQLADQQERDEVKPRDKDEFQLVSEMFNAAELETVRRHGGRMHREQTDEAEDNAGLVTKPRLLLQDTSPGDEKAFELGQGKHVHGKLQGVYQHYLLVRPYPSLRILFASPSLRMPGILQSPFMKRIGSSERVRDELLAALAEGRGVTAKIKWLLRNDDEGRNRWIHCTPLIGANGNIGVWMIVLIDDESSSIRGRFRPAPPVVQDITQERERAKMHERSRTRPGTSMSSDTGYSEVGSASEQDFQIR